MNVFRLISVFALAAINAREKTTFAETVPIPLPNSRLLTFTVSGAIKPTTEADIQIDASDVSLQLQAALYDVVTDSPVSFTKTFMVGGTESKPPATDTPAYDNAALTFSTGQGGTATPKPAAPYVETAYFVTIAVAYAG